MYHKRFRFWDHSEVYSKSNNTNIISIKIATPDNATMCTFVLKLTYYGFMAYFHPLMSKTQEILA